MRRTRIRGGARRRPLYEAFPDAPFNIEIKGRRSGIEEAVFGQIEAAAIGAHLGCFR